MPIPQHLPARGTARVAPFLHLRRDAVASALAAIFAPPPDHGGGKHALPPEPYWQYRDYAEAIGHLYLAQEPAERNASDLLRQLPEIAAQAGPGTPAGIRTALAARRQADFVGGDTVLLDGWIIARSEARLCALAALAGA